MAIIRPPAQAPARSLVAPLGAPLRPLCPACHTTVVRISVAAAVLFEVVCSAAQDDDRDLQVISHEWQDASWERDARASCASCGWEGSVADVQAAAEA